MLSSSELDDGGDLKLLEEYSISSAAGVKILEFVPEKEILYYLVEPGLSKEELSLISKIKKDLETVLPEIMVAHMGDYSDLEKEILGFSWKRYDSGNAQLREKFDYYIRREYFGYGIIDAIMQDPNIEDISCDGPGIPIFVYHARYDVLKTNVIFRTAEVLSSFLVRLAQKCSKSISVRNPILDGTTREGHRVQGTYEREVTTLGSSFTMRLFRKKVFTPSNILVSDMADANILAYLWLAVEHLESGMIAGPPGAGKTSFLNAMMQFAPENTKILSIEETRELNIDHPNWISTATREISPEMASLGTQSLSMFDLVKAAMRQRPTYIVVGEVRGEETYSLFQAMSTGHTTFSTIHADSLESLVNRLESEPMNIPRIMISSLRIVIFLTYYRNGNQIRRRVSEIDEIHGIDGTTNDLLYNSVFRFNPLNNTWYMSEESLLLKRLETIMNETERGVRKIFNERRERVLELYGKGEKGITGEQ